MAQNLASDAPPPRLCVLLKTAPTDEYGYNLHAEKGKQQFIGTVDENSPAHRAGLRPGDRIYAVNGQSIVGESHRQVVQKIKEFPLRCELLVISEAGAEWYKERNIPITLSLPNIIHEPEVDLKKEADSGSPTPATNWYTPKEAEKTNNGVVSSPSGNEMSGMPRPRLCTLRKTTPENEFGFNLHAEKGRGHFVGAVDKGGIGERAGLCIGQRIVGVNGKLIYPSTPHREVVAFIKEDALVTELLVASEEVDRWYTNNHSDYSFQNAEIFALGNSATTEMDKTGDSSVAQQQNGETLSRSPEMPASTVEPVTAEENNSFTESETVQTRTSEQASVVEERSRTDTIEKEKELPTRPLGEHVTAQPEHNPPPRTTVPGDHAKRSPAPTYQQQNATERNGDLDIFSLSAEEARNRLMHRKKKDPRLDPSMSIEEKHRLISNM